MENLEVPPLLCEMEGESQVQRSWLLLTTSERNCLSVLNPRLGAWELTINPDGLAFGPRCRLNP
jgi:hypothetical protein